MAEFSIGSSRREIEVRIVSDIFWWHFSDAIHQNLQNRWTFWKWFGKNGEKKYFQFEIGMTSIDLNKIFPMKTSELKISYYIENYDKKHCLNIYDDEKCIVYKLSNKYLFQILIG